MEAEAGRRPGEGRPIFPHEWLLLLRCAAHPPESRGEARRPTRQEGRYQPRALYNSTPLKLPQLTGIKTTHFTFTLLFPPTCDFAENKTDFHRNASKSKSNLTLYVCVWVCVYTKLLPLLFKYQVGKKSSLLLVSFFPLAFSYTYSNIFYYFYQYIVIISVFLSMLHMLLAFSLKHNCILLLLWADAPRPHIQIGR